MSSHQNKIGVSTATIVGMNAMIGSGIFAIPASLAFYVGPAGIITIIFVALAVWFMALSIARLASLYPQEGSFYIYAKQWGGHFMGVLSSGAYLLGLIIAMGLLSQMAGIYLQHYFPNYTPTTIGAITLLIFILLNVKGVALSEIGQKILICTTVFPLLATIFMCFTKMNLANLTPFAPFGLSNILTATKDVIFSFFGFEAAASLFSVVKDPEKNVPRALTYSLSIVSLIYIAFAASIILSTPLNLFADPKIPVTYILRDIFPNSRWLIEGIHISVISAILGTIHSMIWSSSSLFFAFAKRLQNQPVKYLVHTKILNPTTSVLFIGISIFISFFTLKEINMFFSLTALFIVFAYITSMITLLKLKSEWENKQNIKTIIGLATGLTIFIFAAQDLFMAIKNFGI
jgi:amino acid transporter